MIKKQWVRVKNRFQKIRHYISNLKPAIIALYKFQSAFQIECTFFISKPLG